MFFTSFKSQFHFALRQRISHIILGVLLTLVSLNYINNVLTFQGRDVTNMYHPMKMLVLSYNKVYYSVDITLLIVQIYPLLVACPAGLIYAKERQIGMNALIQGRVGGFNYKLGKLLAAFCSTAIIFSIPFLIEILLNYITFPNEAIGDFSNLNTYDSEYLHWVDNYAYSELYVFSPILYAIVSTIIFGILSGILGMVASAFSMIIPVKYRVMYLLPSLILLNSTIYFWPTFFIFDFEVTWYSYFLLFNEQQKNMTGFIIVQVLLMCFALIITCISSRRDCIPS